MSLFHSSISVQSQSIVRVQFDQKYKFQKISRFVWRTCVAVHHVWNNNKSLTGFTRISVEPTVDRLYDEFVVGICVGTSVEQPYIRTHSHKHIHTRTHSQRLRITEIRQNPKGKKQRKKNCVVYYFVVVDCRSEWSLVVLLSCVCTKCLSVVFCFVSNINRKNAKLNVGAYR